MHRNGHKNVQKIVVEFDEGINGFLTQQMVNKLLIQNSDSVIKIEKTIIDLHRLESQVLSNPYVESAMVFLTINGWLKTKVKQRTPIARVNAKNNSYYIDRQGQIFPLSPNYSARVLLVTGEFDDSECKKLTTFIKMILADDFLSKEVVGVEKKQADQYELSVRSGDYRIILGSLDEVAIKFKKMKAFYNKAYVDKTIQQYKTINLKFHNQVVCSK